MLKYIIYNVYKRMMMFNFIIYISKMPPPNHILFISRLSTTKTLSANNAWVSSCTTHNNCNIPIKKWNLLIKKLGLIIYPGCMKPNYFKLYVDGRNISGLVEKYECYLCTEAMFLAIKREFSFTKTVEYARIPVNEYQPDGPLCDDCTVSQEPDDDKITDMLNQIKDQIQETTNDTMKQIELITGDGLSTLQNDLQTLGTNISTNLQSQSDASALYIETLKDDAVAAIENAKTSVDEHLISSIQTAIDAINDAATQSVKAVEDKAKTAIDTISENIISQLKVNNDAITSELNKLSSEVSDNIDTITSDVNTAFDNIQTALQKTETSTVSGINNTGIVIEKLIKSNEDSITSAINTTVTNLTDLLSTAENTVIDTINNVIS
uniref:Pep n=1 Tax=Nesodiprion zhejiangensis nucleopolyhedrovirus TaxID=3135970 RepID=A0AAN0N7T2_9BACU